MTDELLSRITHDSEIFDGKPIIRGHRLAVEHVLGMLAAGDTPDEIVAAYPGLERADVDACVAWQSMISNTIGGQLRATLGEMNQLFRDLGASRDVIDVDDTVFEIIYGKTTPPDA